MLKTVAEIAKTADVSTRTVYRRLDNLRQEVPEGLTLSDNGITYFTELGEKKILESLTPVTQKCDMSEPVTPSQMSDNENLDEIKYLRELVKELQSDLRTEREHSRSQADKLASLAEQLAELNKNQQVLLGYEQGKNTPLLIESNAEPENADNETKAKKGLFSFFWKGKN